MDCCQAVFSSACLQHYYISCIDQERIHPVQCMNRNCVNKVESDGEISRSTYRVLMPRNSSAFH